MLELNHWERSVNNNLIIYDLISEDKKCVDKVMIDNTFEMSVINFIGNGTESLYELFKKNLDEELTHFIRGDVKLVNKDIWIVVKNIYSKNAEYFKNVLDKICAIVAKELPIFSDVIPKITEDLENLGFRINTNSMTCKQTSAEDILKPAEISNGKKIEDSTISNNNQLINKPFLNFSIPETKSNIASPQKKQFNPISLALSNCLEQNYHLDLTSTESIELICNKGLVIIFKSESNLAKAIFKSTMDAVGCSYQDQNNQILISPEELLTMQRMMETARKFTPPIDKSTLFINDSSIVYLKYREEIDEYTDYDSNCYGSSGFNHIITTEKILEIAFKNKVDAESFLQKLLDQNSEKLLPQRVTLFPNSNIIKVYGYFSEGNRYAKARSESKQFIQTIQFLCEDQPSLRESIISFAKSNFNF